jgi:hypothetical protein
MIKQLIAKLFSAADATAEPAAPEPMLKRILLIDPRNQSITEIDDTDLASLIDIHLGDQGVDHLQLDHDNSCWYSNRTISNRYAWYFEGMATGEYEERRYCMGIMVGFKEGKALDKATLLDYLRWYDKQNIYGGV